MSACACAVQSRITNTPLSSQLQIKATDFPLTLCRTLTNKGVSVLARPKTCRRASWDHPAGFSPQMSVKSTHKKQLDAITLRAVLSFSTQFHSLQPDFHWISSLGTIASAAAGDN